MIEHIDKTVGVSCSGYVFFDLLTETVIASAKRFDELMKKDIAKHLLGNKFFVIKHVVPEGMIRIY